MYLNLNHRQIKKHALSFVLIYKESKSIRLELLVSIFVTSGKNLWMSFHAICILNLCIFSFHLAAEKGNDDDKKKRSRKAKGKIN